MAVCIATIGRPTLARLMESLAPEVGGRSDVEVVVVDNSESLLARELVDSSPTTLSVRYVVEARPGIAAARNAAVEAARGAAAVIFVDDDEVVVDGWFDALVGAAVASDADVVLGRVLPLFPAEAPHWAPASGLFGLAEAGPSGAVLNTAATGNTLIRSRVLSAFPGPFDEAFSYSGGEDAHFFQRVHRAGFKIVAEPRALALELVTPDRWSMRGIARRGYRDGLVAARLRTELRTIARWRLAVRGLRDALTGVATTALGLLVLRQSKQARGLARLSRGVGITAGLLGWRGTYYRRERRAIAANASRDPQRS